MGLRTISSSMNPLQQSRSGVIAGEGVLMWKTKEWMEAAPLHPPSKRFPPTTWRPAGLKAMGRASVAERALAGRWCAFFCWLEGMDSQGRNLNGFGVQKSGLSPGSQRGAISPDPSDNGSLVTSNLRFNSRREIPNLDKTRGPVGRNLSLGCEGLKLSEGFPHSAAYFVWSCFCLFIWRKCTII